MNSQGKRNSNRDSTWTLAAIVLVAVGLSLLVSNDESPSSRIVEIDVDPASSLEERIDFNLKSADVKSKLESTQASESIPTFNAKQKSVDDFNKPLGLDRKQSVHAVDITRENEAANRAGKVMTPAEQIERSLANEQFLRDYDKRSKEAYVQQFIRNAQEHGLEVELNDDLEVTAVKRRQPQNSGSPGASK